MLWQTFNYLFERKTTADGKAAKRQKNTKINKKGKYVKRKNIAKMQHFY